MVTSFSWCYQASLPELPFSCTPVARIMSPRKMRFQHWSDISHQFCEIPHKSSVGKTFGKQCFYMG